MKQRRFISLALAMLGVSCINVYVTNAPVESRTIKFEGSAKAIAVSHGIDVRVDATLAQGEAVVTTHNDVIDFVKVYVEDGTLKVEHNAPRSINAKTLEVRIPSIDYATVAVSGGAEFSDMAFSGETLTIAASGGADVDVDGEAQMLTVAASGGADVSLDELRVASANIAASGGADVEVWVTESLTVNASGGADVNYKGNPAKVDANRSGGASVEHDND